MHLFGLGMNLFYLLYAGFSPAGEVVGDSDAGGVVLMVRMVQPIQKPRARIPKKPMITGMARAQ